jgi:hypothetical protein
VDYDDPMLGVKKQLQAKKPVQAQIGYDDLF